MSVLLIYNSGRAPLAEARRGRVLAITTRQTGTQSDAGGCMKIVVFGATGGTGRAIVEGALARGIVVTAVARNPATFPLRHALLTVAKGDVMDAGSLVAPVRGVDAVLSALGSKGRGKTTVYSVGGANILNAMSINKVRRFLAVTSAGVEEHDPSFGFVYGVILRRVIRPVYDDMRRMENVVRASDTDWTLLRPAALTDDPGRGTYRTSTGKLPPKGSKVARADLAHLMLEALEEKRYVRQHVVVAY